MAHMSLSYPNPETDCPCQSGLTFEQCCRRFLSDADEMPETAEQLMRSRYCAYALKDSEYLLKTWHPTYRPTNLTLDECKQQWIGLKIIGTVKGAKNDTIGLVHFIARYKINGKAHKMEERSSFEKINRQWLYLTASSDGSK